MKAPELRVIDLQRIGEANWRLRWNSTPGLDYQIQRARNDALSSTGLTEWIPLLTVRATGSVSTAEDPAGPAVRQRFYRILELTNAPDLIPPTIAFDSAQITVGSNGLPAIRLHFLAGDNIGVSSVVIREGTTNLGAATATGGSNWVFLVPANLSSFTGRFFSALAADPSGNTAQTLPVGVLAADPDIFVPIDGSGVPLEGRALTAIRPNQSGGFVYRPGGRPRPGAAPDFFLRFENGVTFRQTNGATALEFARVAADFGSFSPFRFSTPLQRAGGSLKQIRLGPLPFGDLAAAFDLNASNGLSLVAFNLFPLQWRGGSIDDRGLPGAEFFPQIPNLPLPGWSQALPGFLVDFARERSLRLPLSGTFVLPDGSSNAPTVRVRSGNPLWLTLRFDGYMSLVGPVELNWPNGQNVRADLQFDDPKYCLSVESSALSILSISNLVSLLPDNAAGCIPGVATPAQLAQATRCVDSFARAYQNFSAVVASSASNAPASAAEPPSGLNVASAALEAWGFAATAGLAQALPLDPIADLLRHVGRQGGAAAELPEVLAYREALMTARAVIEIGAARGELRARDNLDLALAEVEAAALDRIRNPDAALSLAAMKQSAKLLLDTEAQRQLAGLPAGALMTELPGLFQRFADRLANQFAVKTNVFVPDANPAISNLNRFVIFETLRDLVDLQANAMLLGVDLSSSRLDELTGQLGVQLLRTVNVALASAEAARELPAFTLAAQDFVDLAAWVQLALFPNVPELAALDNGSAVSALAARFDSVAQLELDRPLGDKTIGRHAHEIRALLAVLRQMPGTVTFAAPPFRRAYDKLESQLSLAVSPAALTSVSNALQLVELIEAGILHRELGARFGFPQPVNWETNRLPQVVQRLGNVAVTHRAWRELDHAVRLLLNAADRAALAGDQNLRRAYLLQAAALLTHSRTVAQNLLQDSSGALRLLDFVLPGDIFIDQPAGSICYNRESRGISGGLRGSLRLPKFNLKLTVPNFSIGNNGRFDLSAFGSLQFNGGDFSVPARQPFHFWNDPDRGLAMEGGARLTLSNGMRFDASITLDDPSYCFSLAARGLEFDLGKQLILQRPVLASNALSNFSNSARDAFADYFRGLNGSLETFANAAGSFPPVDETGFGRPPQFVAPEITIELSALNAFSAEIIAAARAGLALAPRSLNTVIESIERLNKDARTGTNALANEIDGLNLLAQRIEMRREMKSAIDLAANMQAVGADSSRAQAAILEGAQDDADAVVSSITPALAGRLAEALDVYRTLLASEAELSAMGITQAPTPGLPADPCRVMTNQLASRLQRGEALMVCAARTHAAALGLNPVTGAVSDTNRFRGLTLDALDRALRVFSELEVGFQQSGSNFEGEMIELLAPIVARERELIRTQLSNAPSAAVTLDLTWRLMDLETGAQLAGVPDGISALPAILDASLGAVLRNAPPGEADKILDRARAEARELKRLREFALRSDVARVLGSDRRLQVIVGNEEYTPDFLTQLGNYFRVMALPMPPGVGTNLDSYVRFKAAELRARPFTPEFLTNRLGEAQATLSAIVALTDWAGFRFPTDAAVLTNLQLSLSNHTFSLGVVAEAQKAWWILGRYESALRLHTEIYRTNLTVGFSNALTQARDTTLLAQNRIGSALVQLVNSVELEDVVVPLPGRVNVESIFGKLCFDRFTGTLDGCFGGRVAFPDVNTNLFFEITEACLSSSGNYSIAAAMATPVPFGQSRLQTSLAIAGSPAGIATYNGGGTLTVPDPPLGDRVFNVTLGYNQAAPRLAFDVQGNNLDLRLSEDFVLFGAGLGFDLSLALPQGSFRANGSAGLFARAKPLPTVVGRTNFHLSVESLTTVFTYSSNAFSVALSNGTIRLPEFFHNGICPTNAGQPATGPQLALVSSNPIIVGIGLGPTPSATFSGALDFRNLGFNIPGLTNLGVEVCSGRLLFRANALPCFTNLNAALMIPLPQETAIIDVTDVAWCVDGFPDKASIALRQPLSLLDLGGVEFQFQTNSTFGFATSVNGANQRHTAFSLSGGVRGAVDANLLFNPDTSGGFSFATSGSFAWDTDDLLPTFGLGSLTFAGRMKIGGATGLELLGVDAHGIPSTNAQSLASITLNGISNVFQLSTNRPFEIAVSGALGSSDFVFFGLGNARFVFDGTPPEPQFTVNSLGFREGTQLALLGQQLLPFRITAGSVTFINSALPLNQLFGPTNLIFTFSGVVNISLGDTNDPTTARLFGALDNVQVSLPEGFSGPPHFSVNTFALALENLTIGDLAGLSGGLAVGNLNDPPNLFFAGLVGGGFNGVSIKAIVATRLDGLLGLCLSANAGPAGIPLDGGTLGGILLTGAEGGVSFLNNFADPCDFKSFLGLTGAGTPQSLATGAKQKGPDISALAVISWEELAQRQKLHDQNKSLRRDKDATRFLSSVAATNRPGLELAKGGGADVPCPTGDCPPATLNLLCQRHPSVAESPSFGNYSGKYASNVIFKFSSIDRQTVDDLLASAGINLNGSPSVVAGNFANATTNLINTLIPRPPASMPAAQRTEINQFINDSLAAMRALVASASQAALQAAAGEGRTPLEAIYETAYAGVKCVDITIQLKGTFSYAPVSVALSATGGAVASTTGSAGILGSVNLFGLPVGTGEFFYSLTDTNGSPNPSLCGGMRMALGPLQLGQMGLAIGCDECVTGTLLALGNFVNGLTGQALADAQPLFYAFIEQTASNRVSNIRSRPINAYFGVPGGGALLTQQEQIAVLTELFNLPKVVEFLRNNPGAFNQFGNDIVQSVSDETIQLVLNIYNSTNPRLQFCGEVEPKLFGFSLTGGNTLVAARAFADKTNLRGDVTFSPSYVFGNLPFYLFSGGLVNNVVPALDEATMGLSLGLPLVNQNTLRLLTTNPVQFASTQMDHLLANATLTFGYELSPFGFKLADGEGRISLPTVANHPDNPARRAARPGDYVGGLFVAPSFPDRGAILKAALDSNVLAQATWAGKGTDLANLFPAGSALAQAAAGRELVRDYFPYGGFMGASKVQLPKPITDAPPLGQLAQIFAPPTNVLQQLTVAQQVFNDYVLGSREVGQLTVYVPFPKPPAPFWSVAQGPQALINTIASIDEDTIASSLSLYPAEQFFMRGDVNAQFLGLPIGQGDLTADPALGLFRLHAGTPAGSWMRSFFDAQLTFEIRSAQYIAQSGPQGSAGTNSVASPEARLQAALDQIIAATAPGSTALQRQQALNNAVERITDTLPKVSLDLALNNFGIPQSLTNVLTANASARIVAYSPRFEPGFVGTGPVADARRTGGVAFRGRFNFANYVVIDNAELGVALRGAALPALSGLFDVPVLGVPGLALHNAHFEFHSDPLVGDPYIAASGSIDPVIINNPLNGQMLLSIRNLTNNGARISAGFELNRAASGPPLPGFALSPSRIDMPVLGPSLSVRIHGATTNDLFAFSSTGPWNANVSIVGRLGIQDLAGNEVLRIGAAGTAFQAAINGVGLSLGQLAITLPTNISITAFPGTTNQQTFTLSSGGVPNRIFISGNGSFILEGGIAGNLPLNGVGFSSISAGASLLVSNGFFRVTINGNLNGGPFASFTNATFASVFGSLTVTRTGVALTGTATMQPATFGAFLLSGVNGAPIAVQLDNAGLRIPNGARVRVLADGFATNDLLALNTFIIESDGDFNVQATSGAVNFPGYFNLTGGSYTFSHSNHVACVQVLAPTFTLFPGTANQSAFAPLFTNVILSSEPEFYADTGPRIIPLPAAFAAHGRLEIGYQADNRLPGLGMASSALSFGTINFGASTTRVFNITNTGLVPLVANLVPSPADAFTVSPSAINLDPALVQPVTVRFTPRAAGAAAGTVTVFHNAGAPRVVNVSGSGRAVPILSLSTTNLNLGLVKEGRPFSRTIRVSNVGLTNLVVTNVMTGPSFSASPSTFTLAPGSNFLMNISLNETEVGNYVGTLNFTANDSPAVRRVALAAQIYSSFYYEQNDGGSALLAVAMNSSGRGFAAGARGTVLHSTNFGHAWRSLTLNDAVTFNDGALLGNNAILVGSSGRVYISDDVGATWQRHSNAVAGDPARNWTHAAFVPGTPLHVLLGTSKFNSTVAIGRDVNNATYNTLTVSNSGFFPLTAVGVSFASGAWTFVIAGRDGRYATSTDQGFTWTPAQLPGVVGSIRDIAFNGPNGVLVVDTGRIFRSTNSGVTWQSVRTGAGPLRSVSIIGTTALAVNSAGQVFRGTSSGLPAQPFFSWATEEDELRTGFGIHMASSTRSWVVGANGKIFHRPPSPPSAGVLTYSPAVLDFGFVPAFDSEPRVLTLNNPGPGLLTITNITLTNANAGEIRIVGGTFPLVVVPDSSVQLNVFYNPTNNGSLEGALLVRSSDPDGLMTIPLLGRSATHGWVLKPALTNASGSAVDMHLFSSGVGYAITSTQLYKTTNGGSSWRQMTGPAGVYRSMDWNNETTGWIGGGDSANAITAGTRLIFRSLNGGTNWTTQLSAAAPPVVNIDMTASGGFAVTAQRLLVGGAVESGRFLATTNLGTNWVFKTTPENPFSGGPLIRISSTEAFVGAGTEVYRTADSGDSWSPVLTNGTLAIRDLDFGSAGFGFAVGNGGSVWRAVSGGDTPGEWSQKPDAGTLGLSRVFALGLSEAWAITDASGGGAGILHTTDGGDNWFEELSTSPLSGPGTNRPTAIFALNSTNAVSLGTAGTVRRLERLGSTLRGLPSSAPVLNFPDGVESPFTTFRQIQIRNMGNRPYTIRQFVFDGSTNRSPIFTIGAVTPLTVNTNSGLNLGIFASRTTPGDHTTEIGFFYDGGPSGTNDYYSFRAHQFVYEPPHVVTLQTDPPGLSLLASGTSFTAPGVFTIVTNVTEPGQWLLNSSRTLEAPPSQVVDGQEYEFLEWVPTRDRSFSFTASNLTTTFTARYVPVAAVAEASEAAKVFSAVDGSKSTSTLPPGLPRGPFLRLSNASLTNGIVGSFNISGAVLLSSDLIEASLASKAVRFPADAGQPMLARISAGSWRFLVSNTVVQLNAQTPSLRLLDNTVNPPSALSLGFNRANGSFGGSFSLPQGWPVMPGLVEFGPGSATLTFTNFVGLSATGQVRALRMPDGSDWAFQQNLNLRFQDGPFTNLIALPASILRVDVPGTATEFFEVRGGAGSTLEVRRATSGIFSAHLKNLSLDLMGRAFTSLSGQASAAGLLTLTAAPPASPFILGPFRWAPSGNSFLDWNIRDGSLAFRISGGSLVDSGSSVPGWPDAGIQLPNLTFDSDGDFQHTINLDDPFNFAGFVLGQANDSADRYVQVKRSNGTLSCKLRDEHEFFGSLMSLGFDINTSGGTASVSGFFKGDFGVDFGVPLGRVPFAAVNLSYDSTPAESGFEFRGKVRVAPNDFRVKFGSGGAEVCHLYCDDDGCSETLCLGF